MYKYIFLNKYVRNRPIYKWNQIYKMTDMPNLTYYGTLFLHPRNSPVESTPIFVKTGQNSYSLTRYTVR